MILPLTVPPTLPRRVAPGRTRPLLRCPTCLRVELRPPDSLGRPAAGRWPTCCGRLMIPAAPAPDSAPDADADASPWADRRTNDRRPARAEAHIECRPAGSGDDVAIALLDVSTRGLKLATHGNLRRGDRVRVAVGPPGEAWAVQGRAAVRWCVPGAEGTALVGLRLRRPLSAEALAALSE